MLFAPAFLLTTPLLIENWSWVAPTGALLGTVKGSTKAPELSMLVVPSVVPQPLTLINEHTGQSVAEAVTMVPGGPCAGDSVGASHRRVMEAPIP